MRRRIVVSIVVMALGAAALSAGPAFASGRDGGHGPGGSSHPGDGCPVTTGGGSGGTTTTAPTTSTTASPTSTTTAVTSTTVAPALAHDDNGACGCPVTASGSTDSIAHDDNGACGCPVTTGGGSGGTTTTAPTTSTTAAPTSTTAAPTSTTAAPTSTTAAPTSTTAAPTSTTAAPTSTTTPVTSTTTVPAGSGSGSPAGGSPGNCSTIQSIAAAATQLADAVRQEAKLADFAAALEKFIQKIFDALTSAGIDVSGVQATYADYSSSVARAQQDLAGIPSNLTGLGASDPQGAQLTLGQATADLTAAQGAMSQAVTDITTMHGEVMTLLGLSG